MGQVITPFLYFTKQKIMNQNQEEAMLHRSSLFQMSCEIHGISYSNMTIIHILMQLF